MRRTWSQNCYWNLCRLRGSKLNAILLLYKISQCQKKKTLFRLDPHLISSSQTVFLAKREQFSFSFMHKLGNQSEWETEDLMPVLVEKGCMSVAEFQLKKSVVWKVFFASLHSRHILSVISDRFKSFEHNTCGFSNTVKRAPERCLAEWCYEHSLGGQGSVVNQLVWIPTDDAVTL